MIKKNLWVVEPETEEEIHAVNELLLKMRKEEERKKKIQFHKHSISSAIAAAIGEIGLDETRDVVQHLCWEVEDME